MSRSTGDAARMPGVDALGPASRLTVFGAEPGGDRPSDEAWRSEAPQIVGERASGLALHRLAAAAVQPPADIASAMTTAHRCDAMDRLAIAALTLPFLRTLDEHDIGCVLIKGLAVARHYPASEMRPFRDIDIVVAPERFADALRLAHEHGLRSSTHDLQPHASFDLHCREGVNLASDNGLIRLDLHHHVSPWTFSRHLTYERLRAHAEVVELHGHLVHVASSTHSLVVAMLHLISEQWQKKLSLVTWSDIGLLAATVAAHDSVAATDELRALQLDWLLDAILAQMPAHARPADLVAALAHPRVPLGASTRLWMLDTGSVVGRHPASWVARLPVPNGAWFLAGSLVPSRAYLRGRFGEDATYRTWWSLAARWATRALRGHDVSSPYSTGRTP